MADRFQSQIDHLSKAVLTSTGDTTPALRATIASWATQLDADPNAPVDLPDAIKSYVKKVALYAYKVMDDDIQRLKAAGYSEDAIFEITLAAALAEGLKRFNTGMDVLRRAPHAS